MGRWGRPNERPEMNCKSLKIKKKEKEGFWRQNLYHRFRDEKIK